MSLYIRLAAAVLMISYVPTVSAQLVPIALDQRLEKSSFILEGKVVAQASYWDDAKSNIYTSFVLEISKVFKGKITDRYVEIITRGGMVGNRMERVTNTLELKIGDVGILTAIESSTRITTQANLKKLNPYAGIQGFIKYDQTGGTAKDVFNTYKNIPKELYMKIIAHTKTNYKTLQ